MFPLAGGRILPTAPGGRPVEWAAIGRSGGVSAAPYDSLNLAGYVGDDPGTVAVNRGRVAALLGLPPEAMVVMDSVHGADVALVDAPGVYPGVDALVTQRPDLALTALGADCVTIGIAGLDGRTVAAVHCGWRGLAGDVLGSAFAAIRDLGTDVRQVILGPAVCGPCYPVPAARAEEVLARTSAAVGSAAVVTARDGQPGIDVRAGLRVRCAELGLPASAVVLAGGCTVEDAGLFSYRRDGVTGRQGLAICTHGPVAVTPSAVPQF